MPHFFSKLNPISCIFAFLASGLQAFGMYNIHALSGVTEGGIFGLILLLDHWFGLSPAITSFVLNSSCYRFKNQIIGK